MTADWRLAVDIGGTFTDIVLFDAATGRVVVDKTLTTPSAPLDGVRAGSGLLSDVERLLPGGHGGIRRLPGLLRRLLRTGGFPIDFADAGFRRTHPLLRFFEGQTQTQIAERVGISQMHVSRLLAKSLARLRDQLE